MMTISSIYTSKRTSPDEVLVLHRKNKESYLLWTNDRQSKVYLKFSIHVWGACFKTYKDLFNMHTSEDGEENKPRGVVI